jgi:hypothetical protein
VDGILAHPHEPVLHTFFPHVMASWLAYFGLRYLVWQAHAGSHKHVCRHHMPFPTSRSVESPDNLFIKEGFRPWMWSRDMHVAVFGTVSMLDPCWYGYHMARDRFISAMCTRICERCDAETSNGLRNICRCLELLMVSSAYCEDLRGLERSVSGNACAS